MDVLIKAEDLRNYKAQFEKLQVITYKDIYINGIGIRNLGIHFMDSGLKWDVKKHRHSFFEFHYVAENYTYTSINDIEQKIEQGSFYLMPPGTYHSHRGDTEKGHVGFAIRWEFIKADSIESNLLPVVQGSHCLQMLDFDRFTGVLDNVRSCPVKDDGGLYNEMLHLLGMAGENYSVIELQFGFIGFILKLVRYYQDMSPKSDKKIEVNQTILGNNIINSAINFIHENFEQDIDVNDIANFVHLSYSHLSRLFKKQTGKTIMWYLNEVRLLKAQKLLLCSDRNIFQVARDTGFSNEYYFCSLFKKTYGISPGEFRKRKTVLNE